MHSIGNLKVSALRFFFLVLKAFWLKISSALKGSPCFSCWERCQWGHSFCFNLPTTFQEIDGWKWWPAKTGKPSPKKNGGAPPGRSSRPPERSGRPKDGFQWPLIELQIKGSGKRRCFTIALKSTTSSRLTNKPRVTVPGCGQRLEIEVLRGWVPLEPGRYSDSCGCHPQDRCAGGADRASPNPVWLESVGQDVGSLRTFLHLLACWYLNNHAWMLPWAGDDGPWTQFLTSVSASFEAHDEGTAAQQLVYRRPSAKGCSCTRSAARALATGGSSVTSSGLHSLYGSTSFCIVPWPLYGQVTIWAVVSPQSYRELYRVSLLLRPNGTWSFDL